MAKAYLLLLQIGNMLLFRGNTGSLVILLIRIILTLLLSFKLKNIFFRSSTVQSASIAPKSEPYTERVPRSISRTPEVHQRVPPGISTPPTFLFWFFLLSAFNQYKIEENRSKRKTTLFYRNSKPASNTVLILFSVKIGAC